MRTLPTVTIEPDEDGWFVWCECQEGRLFQTKQLAAEWKHEHLGEHRANLWKERVAEVQAAEADGRLTYVPDRHVEVLKMRGYFGDRDEVPIREVAKRLGVTEARIYQIEDAALGTLRDAERYRRQAASG